MAGHPNPYMTTFAHTRDVSLRIKGILLSGLLAGLVLAAVTPGAAQREPVLKTVHGQVVDKSETGISGAVVYLKNVQSKTVKSMFTDDQGKYRFSGLDANADYEIHAEYKGDSSDTRRISTLDGRKDIYLILTIQHKK